ncbi:MAG: GntR family transcriptional regulator [Desulfosarcinaceae bacterium]|jgi:GntR family transcriptional repressor for pyruvate dehydrogenase complex
MPATSDKVVAIRRPRIHEQVIDILLRRMVRGAYPVGGKLPTERAMAAEFGVNRATVREALRHLENLELIAVRQGDGARVKDYRESGNLQTAKALLRVGATMQREILTAVLEVRRMVCPEIAYMAALRRTDAHLARLRRLAWETPELAIMERDKQVHRHIGRASGNLIYVLNTNFYEDFFDYAEELYFADPENARRSERFHREIHMAIERQNASDAREVMAEVLAYAENAVYEALTRREQNGDQKGRGFKGRL